MVSSSVPGEGKSSTILMLGQISAIAGKKVLMIECDIRRSTFPKHFGLKAPHGLLSLLSGKVSEEEVVHRHEGGNLDVIFGEESKANPADIFSSERFASFLAEMREKYDYVFIDTPPVLAVPDARIIGQHADAVLYVVRWDSTNRKQVEAGLRLFQQVMVRVSGVVLTQTDPRRMSSYGYEGYGYGSQKSGKYYRN